MSVPYAKILAMEKWNKFTYVCPNCDSYVEYTAKEVWRNKDNEFYCVCGGTSTLLSVVDATIQPIKKKEETVEITEYIKQELELSYGNQITQLENELNASESRVNRLEKLLSDYSRQLSSITDNLTKDGWYSDSIEKDEVLEDLCTILDYEAKHEVEFTATITVNGRCEIPLNEDVEGFLSDIEFDVTSYGGDVIVEGHEVDRVWEN
jgi:uncharacterized protein YsxB (DUF464 family)